MDTILNVLRSFCRSLAIILCFLLLPELPGLE